MQATFHHHPWEETSTGLSRPHPAQLRAPHAAQTHLTQIEHQMGLKPSCCHSQKSLQFSQPRFLILKVRIIEGLWECVGISLIDTMSGERALAFKAEETGKLSIL